MAFNQEWTFRDCPWCGLKDADFTVVRPQERVERRGSTPRFWTFLGCPRCASPVLIEHDAPTAHPGQLLSVVPSDEATVEVDGLPDDVAGYYSDARRVSDAGVPDAAAVSLRKTLEAAAAHRGHTENNLVKRIEGLIEEGHVTKDFGQMLQHIRKLGNVGAHAGDDRVDEVTARRAMRFTTLLLRNLFEIPAALSTIQAPESAEEAAED